MSEVGWWKNKPKQTFGTPLYMSPEIYYKNGGGITYLPTVDIWSFGVMMYEVLTHGSFPFGNIDSVEDFPQYMECAYHNSLSSPKSKGTLSEYLRYIARLKAFDRFCGTDFSHRTPITKVVNL